MSKTRNKSSSMDSTNDFIPNAVSDPLLDNTDSRLSTTTKDTIELLYLWINRDKTGFIREQGFNFSPNYRFDLKATNDGQNYELSCTANLDYPNVWITRNILNLTAVVGENGSGKTLLLGHLSRLSLYPIFTDRRPDYMRWIDEKNRKNKTIQAYCFNGVVYIYHNFPAGELQNNTPFHVISINESNPGQILEKTNMQTRIYITNGQTYSNLVTESSDYVENIIFSPAKNNALSKMFFEKICPYLLWYRDKRISFLQNQIASSKTFKDFEQLIIVHYYHFMHSEGLPFTSLVTANIKFTVNVSNPVSWFDERYSGILDNDYSTDDENLRALSNALKNSAHWRSLLSSNIQADPVAAAYISFLFELLFVLNQSFEDDSTIESIDTLHSYASLLLDIYENLDDHHEEVLSYYKAALEEIEELYEVLKECPVVDNYAPPEDWAVKTGVQIESRVNPEAFKRFCQYINKLMRKEQSFVLKYIDIEMPPMSSGEQALLNIFSWLRLLPSYKEILGRDSTEIKDNVLLLLDEVDLYMHPEWQRKFLKLLSDELAVEYPDKKIQVVISTHSPLVLSDIPAGNIIYLEKNDVKCTIAQGPELEESFGSNIFSLLRDSFFLQRSMGEFAYSRITDAIADLNELKKNPENAPLKEKCRDYNRLIGIIGEPVIKRKLHMLYTEIFGNDPDEREERYFAEFSRLLNSNNPQERKKYRARLQKMLSDATDD